MEYSDIVQLGAGSTRLMHGWQEPIYIDNPGAGQVFSRTVPGETWERLISVYFLLTTSATVANRYPYLHIKDGDGNIMAGNGGSNAVIASTIINVFFQSDMGSSASEWDGSRTIGTPNLILPSGWTYSFDVANLDAADTLTNIRMIVERYPSDIASGEEYYESLKWWRQEKAKLSNAIGAQTGG